MVDGSEYRFISGSKKIRSTRIGIDSVLDSRSVCSLILIVDPLLEEHPEISKWSTHRFKVHLVGYNAPTIPYHSFSQCCLPSLQN